MYALAAALAHLLHWWWHCDAIRVSPHEGQLLRLAPGSFIRIAGEPAQVVKRATAAAPGGLSIVVECDGAEGRFELRVAAADGGRAAYVRRRGHEWRLAADDIEIVPVPRG
jgi:hypothetical protein